MWKLPKPEHFRISFLSIQHPTNILRIPGGHPSFPFSLGPENNSWEIFFFFTTHPLENNLMLNIIYWRAQVLYSFHEPKNIDFEHKSAKQKSLSDQSFCNQQICMNDRRFPAPIILDKCKSWTQIGTTATWYFLCASYFLGEKGLRKLSGEWLQKHNWSFLNWQQRKLVLWGGTGRVKILGWGEKKQIWQSTRVWNPWWKEKIEEGRVTWKNGNELT